MENNALIIIEVIEPGKAPDLRYITNGTTDIRKTDAEFGLDALEYFRNGNDYPVGTTFSVNSVIRFNDIEGYRTFLNRQFIEYLNLQDEIEAEHKKNALNHLGEIITYENVKLDDLLNSAEKEFLLNIKFKLMDIQTEIASQPEGRIDMKKSGNLFIYGFSEDLRKTISDRLNS